MAIMNLVAWNTGFLKDFREMNREARAAPGGEELHDAGCYYGGVTTVARQAANTDVLVEGYEMPPRDDVTHGDVTYVYCVITVLTGGGLDCSKIALIYGEAVPEHTDPFIVNLHGPKEEQCCQGYYDITGTYLGAVDEYDWGLLPE